MNYSTQLKNIKEAIELLQSQAREIKESIEQDCMDVAAGSDEEFVLDQMFDDANDLGKLLGQSYDAAFTIQAASLSLETEEA